MGRTFSGFSILSKYKKLIQQGNPGKVDKENQQTLSKLFSAFTKKSAEVVGSPWAFATAVIVIVIWVLAGPHFHFSDTWQLIINTGTTIVTFLIVFLIQHTQNRDTRTIQLKLDELIKSHKPARNSIINLDKLSDEDLEELEEKYKELSKAKNQGG